jgi:hypothetical protein
LSSRWLLAAGALVIGSGLLLALSDRISEGGPRPVDKSSSHET